MSFWHLGVNTGVSNLLANRDRFGEVKMFKCQPFSLIILILLNANELFIEHFNARVYF